MFGARICLLLAVVVSLVGVSAAPAQLRVREIPPKVDFFRFKARYVVLATNEVVEFNLVRPCYVVQGRDMLNDSVGLFPKNPHGYFNGVDIFPKITKDRHVIVVHTPHGCEGQTTANGQVPKDLLPYTTWFEDPDDLGYGWQYVSEEAYKSSFAKIRFEGAVIESATRADFVEWQKQAVIGFMPSKIIRSPFGFSFEQIHSTYDVPPGCFGVVRLHLPSELQKLAAAARPASTPRFWTLRASHDDGREAAADELRDEIWGSKAPNKHLYDGFVKRHVTWPQGNAPDSLPTALGTYKRPDVKLTVRFPQITAAYGPHFNTPEHLASNPIYIDVSLDEDKRGFFACYFAIGASEIVVDAQGKAVRDAQGHLTFLPVAPDLDKKDIRWRVDHEPVAGQQTGSFMSPSGPNQFFEGVEHLYEHTANPL